MNIREATSAQRVIAWHLGLAVVPNMLAALGDLAEDSCGRVPDGYDRYDAVTGAARRHHAPVPDDALDPRCQWWAPCQNPARLVAAHPTRGLLPTCERCATTRHLAGILVVRDP